MAHACMLWEKEGGRDPLKGLFCGPSAVVHLAGPPGCLHCLPPYEITPRSNGSDRGRQAAGCVAGNLEANEAVAVALRTPLSSLS